MLISRAGVAVIGSATLTLSLVEATRDAVCPHHATTEDAAAAPGVAHSSLCAQCHSYAETASGLRDADGRNIAPYDLWQGTMMANSARDPLWQAVMSVEVATLPDHRDQIEAECMKCHAPVASAVGLQKHESDRFSHLLDCDSQLGELAQDGVSCTICHGISPEGLGSAESFSANYKLDSEKRLFGPHQNPLTRPMQVRAGFTPTYSAHIRESALCGSCHTLETPTFHPSGEQAEGKFLEQAPYLEWRNSAFQNEVEPAGSEAQSCQDCHLRSTNDDGSAIRTRIARNPAGRDFPPTQPRSPYGAHQIVGGNTLVLSMLRDHGELLGVAAPPAAFDAAIEATRKQLREDSARLTIHDAVRAPEELRFAIQVENLSGHKLPTAHPTRRAWLHVRVTDAQGKVLLESGAVDAQGRILGSNGKPLPSERVGGAIEKHHQVIRSAETPVIYQAVMADTAGNPTHVLLQGARWYKDTRLLPKGWSADHPQASRTAPVGTAGDDNFIGGSDRVQVRVPIRDDVALPLQIDTRLLYQSLNARWAAELFEYDTPEVQLFRQLYEQSEVRYEQIARQRAVLRSLGENRSDADSGS